MDSELLCQPRPSASRADGPTPVPSLRLLTLPVCECKHFTVTGADVSLRLGGSPSRWPTLPGPSPSPVPGAPGPRPSSEHLRWRWGLGGQPSEETCVPALGTLPVWDGVSHVCVSHGSLRKYLAWDTFNMLELCKTSQGGESLRGFPRELMSAWLCFCTALQGGFSLNREAWTPHQVCRDAGPRVGGGS